MTSIRERVRATRGGRLAWRGGVSVLGVAVILVGIVLLPLPGPGWLTVFAGLGILSTEYAWAARLLRFVRAKVSSWTAWVGARSRPVQVLIAIAGLVVVAALVTVAIWYYTR